MFDFQLIPLDHLILIPSNCSVSPEILIPFILFLVHKIHFDSFPIPYFKIEFILIFF